MDRYLEEMFVPPPAPAVRMIGGLVVSRLVVHYRLRQRPRPSLAQRASMSAAREMSSLLTIVLTVLLGRPQTVRYSPASGRSGRRPFWRPVSLLRHDPDWRFLNLRERIPAICQRSEARLALDRGASGRRRRAW